MKNRKAIPVINLPGEIWKDIPGFELLYAVSNKLRVKSYAKNGVAERILRPGKVKFGYLKYTLRKSKQDHYVTLHRVVAQAFLKNPDNLPCINHIDNNPLNNEINNLEWCTFSHNSRQAYKSGRLSRVGIKNHMSKLTEKQALHVFNYQGDKSILEAKYGISRQTINDIKAGRRWYLVTGKRHKDTKIRICEQ